MPLATFAKRTIPNTQGKLLKTGEAASLLHVSPQTLRDWSDSGKITAVIADSGHRTYYEAEVNRVALAEAGITQYWNAGLNIGLKADGSIIYITEEYVEASSATEALAIWNEDYNRFWNYTNSLQEAAHAAALHSEPTIDPTSYEAIGLFEDEAGQNCVTLRLIAIGREKNEVVEALKQETAKAIAYLQANYTPKVNYDWYGSDGSKVFE